MLARYIDCFIPLVGGLVVLLFPQQMTRKDLSLPENARTRKTLRTIGATLLLAGTMLLIATMSRNS
jgi:uncharacterized protein YjeT (DUF2065 family)